MLMKNEILKNFFKEYKEYLVETDHSANTADQYCTYLRKACDFLNLDKDYLESMFFSSDINVKAILCERLMSKLSNEFENTDDKILKKHISNYKSAVSMLTEFIDRFEIEANTTTTAQSSSAMVELPFESTYDQKTLIEKFKARLVTQDRYYYDDNSCFPTRIINRIATKICRKNLYNTLILNTRFLYDEDKNKYFRLCDITKLIIKKDGCVKIEVKGKQHDVYTEVWTKGTFIGYELLRVSSVKYISLDHVVSIHSELKIFIDAHVEYRKFSDDVIKHRQASRDIDISRFSSDYFELSYKNLSVNEDVLIDEVIEFIDHLELLILHKSYNSSKNDNV